MKNTRNIIKQLGISMLAALMLLCLVWGASAEGVPEVPLSDYATLTPALYADSNKTPLPVYVENGQSLFFSLSIDSIDSIELVKKLGEGGTVDFTVFIDFVDKIAGSYPINLTVIHPRISRWTISPLIRLQKILCSAGGSKTISSRSVLWTNG